MLYIPCNMMKKVYYYLVLMLMDLTGTNSVKTGVRFVVVSRLLLGLTFFIIIVVIIQNC